MSLVTRATDGAIESEPPSGPLSREEFAPRRRSDGAGELTDSRGTGIVLGELSAAVRPRIAEILRGSKVFSAAEIGIALELFDEAIADSAGHSQTALRNPQSSPDYLFLGAFTPEEVLVGYACWGPTPATDRTWDLYWIAVDTSLHGAGIGTILLEEVERRLVRQHARMLIAETSSRSDYAATRGFYERRGYREAARVRDFYAPGDDRIIFVKRFLYSPKGGEQIRDE
ncbi:MAG TPA: GNAT family N-acetyltransferase [Gemmatimonadaceae bacterium]|nr:GNAT family N-acetyltransferase [Gemmatimonadaceae bacterium]